MFNSDQEELAFYRQLHKSMNAAIYTINLETYSIEWVNDSIILESVLGLSQQEVLAQGEYIAAKLLSNHDFEDSIELAVQKFKKQSDISWTGVYKIKHREGDDRWVVYSISSLELNDHGLPNKAICVALDPQSILNSTTTLDAFIKYISRLTYEPVRDSLTNRQREILKLILNHESEEGISLLLGISKYTVVDHKKSLYKKLDCRNSKELFAMAQKMGIAS